MNKRPLLAPQARAQRGFERYNANLEYVWNGKMRVLGYPLTWPTTCFLNQHCSEPVFAHTNGFGDFVLFDELGPPWPIHDCYLNRFVIATNSGSGFRTFITSNTSGYEVPTSPTFLKAKELGNIKRVAPEELSGKGEVNLIGYVQDYVERRADKFAATLGTLGQQLMMNALGRARSQITIVTGELKSYTVFADLSEFVVQSKDLVMARVRAVPLIGIPGHRAVLVATDLMLTRSS
jgi:hypothetical protein